MVVVPVAAAALVIVHTAVVVVDTVVVWPVHGMVAIRRWSRRRVGFVVVRLSVVLVLLAVVVGSSRCIERLRNC